MKLFSIINRKDCTFNSKRNLKKYSLVFLKHFPKKKVFGGPCTIWYRQWYVHTDICRHTRTRSISSFFYAHPSIQPSVLYISLSIQLPFHFIVPPTTSKSMVGWIRKFSCVDRNFLFFFFFFLFFVFVLFLVCFVIKIHNCCLWYTRMYVCSWYSKILRGQHWKLHWTALHCSAAFITFLFIDLINLINYYLHVSTVTINGSFINWRHKKRNKKKTTKIKMLVSD